MKKIIITISALIALTTGALGEGRTWTQASTGNTVQGEFLRIKGEKTAIIKIGRKEVPVRISTLSEADQKFITEAVAAASKASLAKIMALPTEPTTVTLHNVHICCKVCEERAVESVNGHGLKFTDKKAIKIQPNRTERTVMVSGPNGKEVMTALKGLTMAGFYGKSDHPTVKYKDIKEEAYVASTMTVRNVYVCCDKYKQALERAVKIVSGVKETTLNEDVVEGEEQKEFKVFGNDFKPYEVMQAMRNMGFGGSYR